MVRTKADPGVKASGGKAPRKTSLTPSGGRSGGRDGKSNKYSGGNPYNPCKTPDWQKQITTFFNAKPSEESDSQEGGSSHSSEEPPQQDSD